MLALVATGHVAAAPDQTNQEILVKFTGRFDSQWEPVMQEPNGRNFHVARYQWTLTWRGRVNQLVANPNVSLKVGTLKGSVTYVDKINGGVADCSGRFVAKAKTKIPMNASVDLDKNVITFNPRFPVSHEFLLPTNKTSLFELCSEVVWWGLPDRYRVVVFPLKLKGKGDARGVNVTVGPRGRNREKAVLRESFSMTIAPRP